jgi:hypothetical protein
MFWSFSNIARDVGFPPPHKILSFGVHPFFAPPLISAPNSEKSDVRFEFFIAMKISGYGLLGCDAV